MQIQDELSSVIVTSPILFHLAKSALARCEQERWPVEAITCVILAVATLEAYINELVEFGIAPTKQDDHTRKKNKNAIIALAKDRHALGYIRWKEFELLRKLRNLLVHAKSGKITTEMVNQGKTPESFITQYVEMMLTKHNIHMSEEEIARFRKSVTWLGEAVLKHAYRDEHIMRVLQQLDDRKLLITDARKYIHERRFPWTTLIITYELAYWACQTASDITQLMFDLVADPAKKEMLAKSYGDCFRL